VNLFNIGSFNLHSGLSSDFKIDCDALTDDDIDAVAIQLVRRLPAFRTVEGIPQGGIRLAEAMYKYASLTSDQILVVDDVFTTGRSMETQRDYRTNVIGAVLFARNETPAWITSLFRMMP
jgi:orotate phosphoribosyltransferase